MAKYVSEKYNCVSIVYNSKTTKVLGVKNPFETKKPINHLLSLNKGIKPIVIFGSELMNRGISFVGKGFNPSTATVMFYKGGLKSHVIGLVQKIGRITGTSRPDLNNRKLYCSQEVYDNYKAYIENQKAVYGVIKNNPELNMNSILETVSSVRLTRPVDRPALKKVNKDYFYASDITSDSNNSEGDSGFEEPRNNIDKMKRLVGSWAKVENTTDVAKLFRVMVENDGSMLNGRVKELIGGLDITFYKTLTQENHSSKWNTVFRKDTLRHYIRDEAMEYHETLDFEG